MVNASYQKRIEKHVAEIPSGTQINVNNIIKKCKMINANQVSRYLCAHPDVTVVGKTPDRCNIYIKGGH